MSNNKTCSALHHFPKGFLNLHFSSCINGRCGLIQNKHLWQAKHKSCNTQKLFLPLRKTSTILTNYSEDGTVLISTHLILDVEQVLDDAVFLQQGRIVLHESVDSIRERTGESVDALFREMFRAQAWNGGNNDAR